MYLYGIKNHYHIFNFYIANLDYQFFALHVKLNANNAAEQSTTEGPAGVL
ncbi:hypothetical protein XBJ1_2225 [Xenorhabdus bovienii SS-2004]|uniref:Uncharacterized protein n=1 Tax=Xenorhabdus bovienii (strain SS-2004) TaxID=406818 RepID=D3V178_XENBS|nr:hypothetical protein XBJ1_2225 [Xenorhabdus bovienii SS-2004]